MLESCRGSFPLPRPARKARQSLERSGWSRLLHRRAAGAQSRSTPTKPSVAKLRQFGTTRVEADCLCPLLAGGRSPLNTGPSAKRRIPLPAQAPGAWPPDQAPFSLRLCPFRHPSPMVAKAGTRFAVSSSFGAGLHAFVMFIAPIMVHLSRIISMCEPVIPSVLDRRRGGD